MSSVRNDVASQFPDWHGQVNRFLDDNGISLKEARFYPEVDSSYIKFKRQQDAMFFLNNFHITKNVCIDVTFKKDTFNRGKLFIAGKTLRFRAAKKPK